MFVGCSWDVHMAQLFLKSWIVMNSHMTCEHMIVIHTHQMCCDSLIMIVIHWHSVVMDPTEMAPMNHPSDTMVILSPPVQDDMKISSNRGTPSHHPFIDEFSLINHPAFLGYPHVMETPIWWKARKSHVTIFQDWNCWGLTTSCDKWWPGRGKRRFETVSATSLCLNLSFSRWSKCDVRCSAFMNHVRVSVSSEVTELVQVPLSCLSTLMSFNLAAGYILQNGKNIKVQNCTPPKFPQ